MLLKPLVVAAVLATAAQAFLLPPEITQSDVNIADHIPELVVTGSSHHVNLSCPGCFEHHKAYKHASGKITEVSADRPVHLELYFEILHEDNKQDRLVITTGSTHETYEVYPNAMSNHSPMLAHIVSDVPSKLEKILRGHRSGSRYRTKPLGYTLATFEHPLTQGDGLQMIDLGLQVLTVGDKFIEGIPTVHIKLIKDIATGALVIGNIEQTASETKTPSPMDKQEDCTSFLCEWMSIVKDKAEKIKVKCGGKAKTGSRPPPGHLHKGGRPHKIHHHHKGNGHSWSELMRNIATHILLPVAVGVIAGVTVSMIGMAVGTLIVSVWRLLFRRRSPRHTRCRSHSSGHKAPKTEAVVAEIEEKAGLMGNQEGHGEAPPAYVDDTADVSV